MESEQTFKEDKWKGRGKCEGFLLCSFWSVAQAKSLRKLVILRTSAISFFRKTGGVLRTMSSVYDVFFRK